jgi:hypothetical protein
MKKVLFAVLIFVAVATELLAVAPVWNKGYVILPGGRKLEGELNYNWKAEVVQLRLTDGLVRAYSAGRLDSFVYFDNLQQFIRLFRSVNLPDHRQEPRPVFLEEVVTGPLTVLRRLRHARELVKIARPSMYSDDSELVKDLDNFVYVVIDTAGTLFDLASFSKTLWPLISTYQEQLALYMKSREMDTSTTAGRLLLINQYNYLSLGSNELSNAGASE